MIKVQKAPLSFVYNKPGTNHYLVCYDPGDDMITMFRYAYKYIKYDISDKRDKKIKKLFNLKKTPKPLIYNGFEVVIIVQHNIEVTLHGIS